MLVTLLVAAAIVAVLVVTLGDATLVFHEVDAAVDQRDDLGDNRFRVVGTPLPGLVETVVDGETAVVFTLCSGGVFADVVHVGDPAELFQPGVPVVLQGVWCGTRRADRTGRRRLASTHRPHGRQARQRLPHRRESHRRRRRLRAPRVTPA